MSPLTVVHLNTWLAWKRTRERVSAVTVPPLPLSWAALFLLVAIAMVPLARWDAVRKNNAEWRGRIADSSEEVRKVLAAGDAEAADVDTRVINAIEVTNAKLRKAEQALRESQLPSSRPAPDRCSVPIGCLQQ